MGTKVTKSYIKLNGALVDVSAGSPIAAVPDSGYDIVIGFIQSNMRGVADDYVASDQFSTDSNIYMWHHGSSSIIRAQEPMSTAETTTGMGASNTFLKDYAAESLANGRKLLIVNVARGGTGFTTPSTNTSGGSGLHWRYDLPDDSNNLALRSVVVSKAALAAAGPGSRYVAFLANHGSTDGTNNSPKATFKAYLQAWIPWVRNELNATTIPYVMMQMRPSLIAAETRHRNIADAQAETANELPLVGYALAPVGSEYARADVVHFNAAGMRIIGHNLYTEWKRLKNI